MINNKAYYTNISDESLLEKCKEFYSTGCESYAISFDNSEENKSSCFVTIQVFP